VAGFSSKTSYKFNAQGFHKSSFNY